MPLVLLQSIQLSLNFKTQPARSVRTWVDIKWVGGCTIWRLHHITHGTWHTSPTGTGLNQFVLYLTTDGICANAQRRACCATIRQPQAASIQPNKRRPHSWSCTANDLLDSSTQHGIQAVKTKHAFNTSARSWRCCCVPQSHRHRVPCFNTRIHGAEWQHNYSTDDAVTDRPVHRCTIRGDIACLRRQWQAHPAKQHQQFNAGKNSPVDMTGRCSRCRQCLAQHQHPNYYCHTGVDNQLQTYAINNMLVVS